VQRLGGDETTSVVDGPLDPQQPLVVQGNYQLNDGAAVRLAEAEEKAEDKAAPAK
jgi:hypothetical protein